MMSCYTKCMLGTARIYSRLALNGCLQAKMLYIQCPTIRISEAFVAIIFSIFPLSVAITDFYGHY